MAISSSNDRLTVIISKDVKKQLKHLADMENRSVSNYVVNILEKHVKDSYEMLMDKYSDTTLNAVAEPTQSYIPQINLPEQETYDKSLTDNSDPNELVGQYLNKHKKTQD